VIRTWPGRVAEAIDALQEVDDLTLGEPQAHGLPAAVMTRRGADEALLERLRAIPSVLDVEIAYAQIAE
jgi:hypothetical protein